MDAFLSHLHRYRILLASKSPRRQQLLRQLGVPFELRTDHDGEEVWSHLLDARSVALHLAEAKSIPYLNELKKNDILITADTTVILEDTLLQKPSGRAEAIKMLKQLSGRSHEVITGVCLRKTDQKVTFESITAVTFDHLTKEEICYYTDHFKPYDKAGSYGIQEWIGLIGINHIEGSYFNVMGLPVQRLYQELKRFTGFK
ncbi:MAG: septum formation protein Maf [Bacteroidales bacterium]|nr:septum formation protein Maf [Bacteroidales bacterium]